MKTFPRSSCKPSVVTVGTFDGVHLGHLAVLSALVEKSKSDGLVPLAVTFDRHPLVTVAPLRAPKMISDGATRDAMLRNAGAEVVIVEFTEDVQCLTCGEWMQRLRDELGMKCLVVGYDNTFGSDGLQMRVKDYRRLAAGLGIEVVEAPEIPGCSSSEVRKAVNQGRLADAAKILGRPFSVKGEVMHGRKLGRTIGIPTANLRLPADRLLPPPGVYTAWTILDNGCRVPSVVNVGDNPTVGGGEVRVEAHLIDFDEDLYDRPVEVQFEEFLREEQKFSSIAELKEAICRDVAATRHRLGVLSNSNS